MDGYYFKQIIFENLNYEISIEKAIYICNYIRGLVYPKSKAFNARLEIIYVYSYEK